MLGKRISTLLLRLLMMLIQSSIKTVSTSDSSDMIYLNITRTNYGVYSEKGLVCSNWLHADDNYNDTHEHEGCK